MPTDRLFRYSISGVVFLLAIIFFDFLFGGDAHARLNAIEQNGFVVFSGLLFTTPIVGIFVSAILYSFLILGWGYKFMFYQPDNVNVIKALLKGDEKLLKRMIGEENKIIWNRKNHREFYKYHQAKVKDCISEEKTSFLERRWSTFWTFANSFCAIVVAVLIVLIQIACTEKEMVLTLDFPKILGLVCIILFVLTGSHQMRNSREDACDVENLWLSKEIEKEGNHR